ncbi:MAG: hypothetical protein ACRYG5_18275 [Janthinobacterium lividum]
MSQSELGLLSLCALSIVLAVIAFLLAREKGRRVALWTVLGIIPVLNLYCLVFFVGAANLRLERKIDALLAQARLDPDAAGRAL